MVEAIYATSTYIGLHVVNILTPIHCLRYVRKDPFAGNVIVIEKIFFRHTFALRLLIGAWRQRLSHYVIVWRKHGLLTDLSTSSVRLKVDVFFLRYSVYGLINRSQIITLESGLYQSNFKFYLVQVKFEITVVKSRLQSNYLTTVRFYNFPVLA